MHYFRNVPGHLAPLHLALHQGNVELARIIFEHGAGVSAEARGGSTPLLRASYHDNMDLARDPLQVWCRRVSERRGRLGCIRRQSRDVDVDGVSLLNTALTCQPRKRTGRLVRRIGLRNLVTERGSRAQFLVERAAPTCHKGQRRVGLRCTGRHGAVI
jgi:hypothetical protein